MSVTSLAWVMVYSVLLQMPDGSYRLVQTKSLHPDRQACLKAIESKFDSGEQGIARCEHKLRTK